ncbi:putative bifunctional diguanylate cyclase/phosphodiesterase [Achromobacter aloeverae]
MAAGGKTGHEGAEDGDLFTFAAEPEGGAARTPGSDDGAQAAATGFTVLSVDDDGEFQRSLRLALANFTFLGEPVRILSVNSAAAAARLLAEGEEIALILLDVVMETDDAGLRLVRSVREVLGNAEVRVVLLTGQPGMAPMKQSLSQLDISDYWLKTDLTVERLHGILMSNLRTWEQIRALGRARKGLQVIVEAGNCLTRSRSLADFSQRVVLELARLLGVAPEGLVCVAEDGGAQHDPLQARIVGAAGQLADAIDLALGDLRQGEIRDALVRALTLRANVDGGASQVLFFPGAEDGPHAATYIATGRVLDPTEHELLRVFAAHINSGLINVALNSRLDRVAYEDTLLSLPNANAMLRALAPVLEQPAPRDRAILFVELDQYTASCLALGVEQGNLMLQKMAARLLAVFPPPSLVARLHDDTFAILGQAERLGHDQVDQLEFMDGGDDQVFISVRAARLDLDAYEGSAASAMALGSLLLRRSPIKNGVGLAEYEAREEQMLNQRFLRSRELSRAVRCDQIGIELQPQVDIVTGRVIAAEALARWTREDGVRVPPAEFIPMAEANGLIIPLGNRVLRLACEALARLGRAGHEDVKVAVNVSAVQFARRGFMQELIAVAAEYGVDPRRLELEITESVAMHDHESNGVLLRGLREAGFPIAIDDFGTGYSSLAYLRDMPVTTLKVDRHFIQAIDQEAGDHVIAEMILKLGRRLNMQLVAEGVETAGQAAWLLAHGCPYAQGFLYAHPEPIDDFLDRLGRQAQALGG